jgi:hypothetical protein
MEDKMRHVSILETKIDDVATAVVEITDNILENNGIIKNEITQEFKKRIGYS